AIHQFEIVGELSHARILEIVADTADVQFCEMMIGWLLQGPAPSSAGAISVPQTLMRRKGRAKRNPSSRQQRIDGFRYAQPVVSISALSSGRRPGPITTDADC